MAAKAVALAVEAADAAMHTVRREATTAKRHARLAAGEAPAGTVRPPRDPRGRARGDRPARCRSRDRRGRVHGPACAETMDTDNRIREESPKSTAARARLRPGDPLLDPSCRAGSVTAAGR